MLELFVLPGSNKYDLPSLDGASLVSASYVQLATEGDFVLRECTDSSQSPNGQPCQPVRQATAGLTDSFPTGALPFLKDGDLLIGEQQILGHLASRTKRPLAKSSGDIAFHALIDSQLLPLVLHSLYSVSSLAWSVWLERAQRRS